MRLLPVALLTLPFGARAQSVEDGSDAAIGPAETRTILDRVGRDLKSPDARVTALRRGEGAVICGSVDVKNRMGLYTGPRGFVADLSDGFFGRVPDGPELLSPSRMDDYRAMERTRDLYFKACLR
ncbi:hypothetical protein [Methylobacterium durans]|uniref:Uncharacterized protein n=1 Tax=Methylobacterium durans TaxID=2202825 RepID=A0A2U8WBG8_9HYPH|nr:hypothetical protein [Methylobacterium durans]AWN43505.1 hypothetical protein DK389_27090 [Methylobacterium durans]